MKWKSIMLIAGLPHIAVAADQYSTPETYAAAVEAVGGAQQTLIDFEDLDSGTVIDSDYAGLGLNFSSPQTVSAEGSVHGSSARGELALQVDGTTPQSLTLLFDTPQRALSFYVMDVGTPLSLSIYKEGNLVETFELTDVAAEDTANGIFKGVVFPDDITRAVFTGSSNDGIGLDDLTFVAVDGDLDGYGPGEGRKGGDCNDDDATVYPGATEVVDSKDQNCDGIVDNALVTYQFSEAFNTDATAAGVGPLSTIDFEDVDSDFDLTDAYEGLGVFFSASSDGSMAPIIASSEVCGASANGDLTALVSGSSLATYTWFFAEPQTFMSARIMDLGPEGFDVKAYDDGGLLYDFHLDVPGEDVANGIFRGLNFHLPVTRVLFSSPSTSDCIGFDDLAFVSLDKDLDGYGPGVGRLGNDCDDDDPLTYPGAPEIDGDGIDQDCDGLVDNAVTIYTNPVDFEVSGVESGVGAFVKIDFEDLSEGDAIADQYLDLGARFTPPTGILADDYVYDSKARGRLAARVNATEPAAWTWHFEEPQRYVGAYFLDTGNPITVQAFAGDQLVNEFEYLIDGENTPGGFFRGFAFSTPVDRLAFLGNGGDGIGFDDVIFDGIDDDQDGFTIGEGDCDDSNDAIHPDAEETCNEVDDNCDGDIDEGFDADGDGFSICVGDCDDARDDVAPGREEICDGVDQDCDEAIDEGFDADDDGVTTCDGDCNDDDPEIHPGVDELCNGVDDDCNGDSDDGFDVDGDGYFQCELEGLAADCDDANADINPGADDTPYNGVDEDCQDGDLVDVDGDGFVATAADGDDCDDTNGAINPDGIEIPYNGVDEDCSGADLVDVDGDGYALDDECDDEDANTYPGAPEIDDERDNDCDDAVDENLDTTDDDGDGFAESDGDCDDGNASVYPGNEEVPYNNLDDDCQDGDLKDVDGDGFEGGEEGTDCNDNDETIHPEAAEVAYDGVDQDCSGADLVDVDGDGFAGGEAGDDCDDGNDSVYPGAPETPYDGVDQDCDGEDLLDVDGDGSDASQYGGDDCDDTNDAVHPGAPEVADGLDNNCDGTIDEGTSVYDDDGDGRSEEEGDCDDTDPEIVPGGTEYEDGVDQDCDDLIDEGTAAYDDDLDGFTENDGDCNDSVIEINPDADEVCDNDIDENCDGLIEDCPTPTPVMVTDPPITAAPTPTPSATPIPTATPTAGATPSAEPTGSEATPSAEVSESPDISESPEATPSVSESEATPSFEESEDPSVTPDVTPTPGQVTPTDAPATETPAAATPTDTPDEPVTDSPTPTGDPTDPGSGCECNSSGAEGGFSALFMGLLLFFRRRK